MEKQLSRTIILVLFILFPLTHVEAEWQVMTTNYYPSDYSAGTQNWKLLLHPCGFLYSANNYGLLEYDGNQWRLYGLWNSTPVRSICIGAEGEIYAGGTDIFGVFRASQSNGMLTFYPLSKYIPDEYQHFGEVWNISSDDDALYVQTRNYVFRLSKVESRKLNEDVKNNIEDERDIMNERGMYDVELLTEQDYIYCSAFIRGGIYFASTAGVYFLMGQQVHSLSGAEQLLGYHISAIAEFGDNAILIATETHGLFLYDGKQIIPFPTQIDDELQRNQIFSLATNGSQVALGTVRGGVYLIDANGNFQRVINFHNGLQNNTVLALAFNSFGALWAGLDQGISLIDVNSPIMYYRSLTDSYGAVYTSMLYENNLYLGTNQGLYSVANEEYTTHSHGKIRLPSASSESLEALLTGQVWSLDTVSVYHGRDVVETSLLCSHHNGLYEVRDKKLIPIIKDLGCWRVRQLDARNAIVGSYNGFYLLEYENGMWQKRWLIDGFDGTAYHFELDARGDVYVMANRQLLKLRLNASRDSFTKELLYTKADDQDYIGIHRLSDTLLITGKYFCRVVDAYGTIKEQDDFYAHLGGLGYYSLIVEDAKGRIYYLNDALLKCISGEDDRGIPLLQNGQFFFVDGFPNISFIQDSILLLGGTQGVCKVDMPAMIRLSAIHSAAVKNNTPYIREFYVTLPQDSLVYSQGYSDKDIFGTETNPFRLRYAENCVRFIYASSIDNAQRIEYSTMMEPIDEYFSTWSANSMREYTNLSEGLYSFVVRLRGVGEEEYTETRLVFRVMPPWYRTWWACTLWALIIVMGILYFTWRLQRHISLDKERLERQKERELYEQRERYQQEAHEREKRILKLENEKANYELRQKSQELSSMMLTQTNRQELIADVQEDLNRIADDLRNHDYQSAGKRLQQLQSRLSKQRYEIDWSRFEENFDIVNDSFLRRLSQHFPWLSKNERKLCVYIRMGLLTKEIAPLMNLSTRGVEMMRYRMRKKMNLDRDDNLEAFFNTLDMGDESSEVKE